MSMIKSSRSRWDILLEALAFLSKESNAPLTNVERGIGLTSRDAAKHLQFLENRDFIRIAKEQAGKKTIIRCNITPKGTELKEKIQGIYTLFGGNQRPEW